MSLLTITKGQILHLGDGTAIFLEDGVTYLHNLHNLQWRFPPQQEIRVLSKGKYKNHNFEVRHIADTKLVHR